MVVGRSPEHWGDWRDQRRPEPLDVVEVWAGLEQVGVWVVAPGCEVGVEGGVVVEERGWSESESASG